MRSPPLLWYFPYYQHTTVVCGGGASISIKALEPTAYSFGFAYTSGGGSPPAFGFLFTDHVRKKLVKSRWFLVCWLADGYWMRPHGIIGLLLLKR
jgi:hypothetical protein